jgi:purine-binding chemotaxis protein CheW
MSIANDNKAVVAPTSLTDDVTEFVTVIIGGQLFGMPISRVQDVFMPEQLTRVPLSQREIAGVLNLRGRIVTAIDMRCRLGLPPSTEKKVTMAVGTEYRGESYGLIIDTVGEVMKLRNASKESNPVNLDPRWARVSAGVHRLDGQLMVILDVDRVLELASETLAA